MGGTMGKLYIIVMKMWEVNFWAKRKANPMNLWIRLFDKCAADQAVFARAKNENQTDGFETPDIRP